VNIFLFYINLHFTIKDSRKKNQTGQSAKMLQKRKVKRVYRRNKPSEKRASCFGRLKRKEISVGAGFTKINVVAIIVMVLLTVRVYWYR